MPEAKAALFSVSSLLLVSISLAIIKENGYRRGHFKSQTGKVLSGHVITTHHVVSPIDCGIHCASSNQCLSYNYRPKKAPINDLCELNNATRKSHTGSYKDDASALYIHFYDQTEDAKSCLDYLRMGATEDGIYTISTMDGNQNKVWCDLSSEPGSAWTLILSYAHKNRNEGEFCSDSFTQDKPTQENNPNWKLYRQTLARMQDISSQSTHVRVTSSFPVYGVDYRDYLRAKISSLDILNFVGLNVCKTVEYIDIRGNKGTDVTVPFWQASDSLFLHTDSSSNPCQYNPTRGSVHSENNFGVTCAQFNPSTRGSENDQSTIQYWFGGYL